MKNENWKDIPGYEGRYQASDLGRVRSVDRMATYVGRWGVTQRKHRGRILKTQPLNGYRTCHISDETGRQLILVHRAVALAFLGEGIEVNHKDKNRANNCASNLEWVTRLENMQHAVQTGSALGRRYAVVGTPLAGGTEVRFESQQAAEYHFRGRNTSAVHNALMGKCQSAYGYVWSRA